MALQRPPLALLILLLFCSLHSSVAAGPGQPAETCSAGDGAADCAPVATELELRAALAAGGADTVVVKAGVRIELTGNYLEISRAVRIVGEDGGDGGALPAIVGAAGSHVLVISGAGGGVAVQLEGLRIEGRGSEFGSAIYCKKGASLVAVRCEVAGNKASFRDAGTRAELRECKVFGSKGRGLYVVNGAYVVVEGGTVSGCSGIGVYAHGNGSGATVKVRTTALPCCSLLPSLCFSLL